MAAQPITWPVTPPRLRPTLDPLIGVSPPIWQLPYPFLLFNMVGLEESNGVIHIQF